MGLYHRKLLTDEENSTLSAICKSSCNPEINDSGSRLPSCMTSCPLICLHDETKKSNKNTFIVVASSLLVATFLLVGFIVFYVKYYSKRRTSQPQQQQQQRQPLSEETHDEFIDEDHGPVLDHPIWYINTVGLQQSIISSITVCQYKKGDGLVEGTECSVCLSEFQEDETLRLLPKCNHAFHIPCIDTWLRSHTNCPMCRAPIVKSTGTPALEPNIVVHSIPEEEETQVEILENNGESSGGLENEICEVTIETEENREVDRLVEPRRSVSMDSLSASKISLESSNGNSNTQLVVVSKLNRGNVSKRMGGNHKLQRQKGSSSKGRPLQNGPLTMKRSSSCSGKFLLRRDIQNGDSVFPLRSF